MRHDLGWKMVTNSTVYVLVPEALLTNRNRSFGYKDGISQPRVKGIDKEEDFPVGTDEIHQG